MKERLFYTLLGVFCLWLTFLAYLTMMVVFFPMVIDTATAMLAGIGVGIITEFFLVTLTLSWQYWFRKKEPAPSQ